MDVSEAIAAFAEAGKSAPPARLGQRYSAAEFLPEHGNTVVCHLDLGAPGHEAVLEARARMRALPEAERFLFTPVESLHMTVFEGVIETRRTADAWPGALDRNAPVDEVTAWHLARLQNFDAPEPFEVRVAGVRPTGLVLTGATPADEERMRTWREALTGPFGYRHADHDAYTFHMTFAYPVAWLPDAVLPDWEAAYREILDALQAIPALPLRPPAFCRFADMTYFEELLVLGR
ncbi:DUF1868 domain-containing protein [Ovoidimarina sediminis]|uniref:DUF1868 domain-containing protein n=1 Tax=Ovoidimarina sediminis TaxID=3079856 RepID=UPI002908134E|nr:DUF1868 domain-containing protein [Rhodophyticola sp. MJ-SS7]MDU8944430.1 DUF1868 domain-containing protein [Rhodophyticola sp. MJ-SS7]